VSSIPSNLILHGTFLFAAYLPQIIHASISINIKRRTAILSSRPSIFFIVYFQGPKIRVGSFIAATA